MDKMWIMTWCRKYFLVGVLLLCLSVDAKDVNFYDDDGSVFTLTIKGGCYNFKPKWDRRATSVDSDSGCFAVYKALNCEGEKLVIPSGSSNYPLSNFGFSKQISSVRLCSPEEEASAGESVIDNSSEGSGGTSPGKGTETMPAAHFSQQEVWDAAVDEHNKYRRIHGVPDIKGNEEMHRDAQEWADRLARNNDFRSTTMGKYGNNLASSFRRTKVEAVRDAIRRWYDKIKFYDYSRPGYNIDGQPTGSFTAIVWKSTTDIGVGIAWDERDENWIVNVFYSPPALRGHFAENVPPPRQNNRK